MTDRNLKNRILGWFLPILAILIVNFFPRTSFLPYKAAIAREDYNSSIAENYSDIGHSIFIKNPTFSFELDGNLYFFDDYDHSLKVYDLQERKFHQSFLNVSDYGVIEDAELCGDTIFALTTSNITQTILKIKLNPENFELATISLDESASSGKKFSKISVLPYSDNFLIALTPEIDYKETSVISNCSPVIVIYNNTENAVQHRTELNLSDNLTTSITKTLLKVLLIESDSPENYHNLVFICKCDIFATNLSTVSLLQDEKINITDTNFHRSLDSELFDSSVYNSISVESANYISLENANFLAISYLTNLKDGGQSNYTRLYLFSLSLYGSGSTFEPKKTINSTSSKYIRSSKSGISFPDNQSITYIEISYANDIVSIKNSTISNPDLEVEYYSEENFIFVQTKNLISLMDAPWSPAGIVSIESGKDLIVVGKGSVKGQNLTFEDYYFCLYTNNNKNYMGFVNVEELSVKDKIAIEESSRICTTIAGAPLYSLPTKILGTAIGKKTSSIIQTIEEYSKIEILDKLCGYTSNNTIFLKVRVNGTNEGYIDAAQIKNKNEVSVFLTNNATIKMDGAKIYLSESKDSDYSISLSSGTRIQVNGTRNRKTGFTSVTYSDEYGNIFEGYVLSDYVQMDGWTNLQIVGSIFIAINFGLLILIFYFKKKRLTTKATREITVTNNKR